MKKTREGFTLVELLIVIVVIGVLAAMMMLSSSEAVSSARASTIITNLRNLKTAALAMYNDNMDTYDSSASLANQNRTVAINEPGFNVLQYLSGKGDIPDKDDYKLLMIANDSTANVNGWYIIYRAYKLTGTEGTRIRTKLAGRAASLGLRATDKENDDTNGGTPQGVYTGGASWVALQVR